MSSKRAKKGVASAAPTLPGLEDLHPIRIVIVIDTTEVMTSVDFQIMRRADDDRPETRRLEGELEPIVEQHGLAAARAISAHMTGGQPVLIEWMPDELLPTTDRRERPSLKPDRTIGRA